VNSNQAVSRPRNEVAVGGVVVVNTVNFIPRPIHG